MSRSTMSNLTEEIRRYCQYKAELSGLLIKTKQLIENINSYEVFNEGNIEDELLPSLALSRIHFLFSKDPTVMVFGQSNKAITLFVNTLLAMDVVPEINGNWWCIKLKYGATNCFILSTGLKYQSTGNFKEVQSSLVRFPTDVTTLECDDANNPMIIDATINHTILQDLPVFAMSDSGNIEDFIKSSLDVLPLFVYALDYQPLSENNVEEIRKLKNSFPYCPILFISPTLQSLFPNSNAEPETTESETRNSTDSSNPDLIDIGKEPVELIWQEQLERLGFWQLNPSSNSSDGDSVNNGQYLNVNRLSDAEEKSTLILDRLINHLKTYVIDAVEYLKALQAKETHKLVTSKLDLNRESNVMPKRIKYALRMEKELYKCLSNIVFNKEEEIVLLIQNVLSEITESTNSIDDNTLQYSHLTLDVDQEHTWYTTVRDATLNVRQAILDELSEQLAILMTVPVDALRQTFSEILYSCLSKLKQRNDRESHLEAIRTLDDIFLAACDIQLQDLCPPMIVMVKHTLAHWFNFILPPAVPVDPSAWQKIVKLEVLESLSPEVLTKVLQQQYKKKTQTAHEAFKAKMKSMFRGLENNFKQMEKQRHEAYNLYASQLAKAALYTVSLSNFIQYGWPEYEKEINRGRFGVIYKCDKWGNMRQSSVVKRFVVDNDRFWECFAMELYRKLNLNHERIVRVQGFMVKHHTSNAMPSSSISATAFIIMDRLPSNLLSALNQKMALSNRIQIAIDVMGGIKHLHSLQLVHGNVCLNNVFLDNENRAKLNIGLNMNVDSGSKPHSGKTRGQFSDNVVGLPIHLAPELKRRDYDSSIDIYAFGILFWHLCAGCVNMPQNYQHFNDTRDMWRGVLNGTRPERLGCFNSKCWNLMKRCWHEEPLERPLPKDIVSVLDCIREKIKMGQFERELVVSDEFKTYKKCLRARK